MSEPRKPRPGIEDVWDALEDAIFEHTQAGLARLVGVPAQMIHSQRRGSGRMPSGKLLKFLGYELRFVPTPVGGASPQHPADSAPAGR